MSARLFGLGVPVMVAGLYFTGAFGSGTWTREVGKPEAEVMAALGSLDITQQPGSPGTDPSRSGGVPSVFQLETAPHEMRWKVMSGDKVATAMIADFTPSADGQKTEVTAHVERGDAPDDFTAPAFRSKRLTLGLFSMALEGKIDALTAPPYDQAACDRLRDQFQGSGPPPEERREGGGIAQAVGRVSGDVMKIAAFQQEAHRLGCDRGDGTFHSVSDSMGSASASPLPPSPGSGKVNFTPGQPMVDPSPPGERRRW